MKTSQVIHFDTDGGGALSVGISTGPGVVRAHFESEPYAHHLPKFNVGLLDARTARAFASLLNQAADLADNSQCERAL